MDEHDRPVDPDELFDSYAVDYTRALEDSSPDYAVWQEVRSKAKQRFRFTYVWGLSDLRPKDYQTIFSTIVAEEISQYLLVRSPATVTSS